MKKSFLIFTSILFGLMLKAQEPSILDSVVARLDACRQNWPLEKVFLQTDKESYAPGEVIWYAALVYDRTSQKPSVFSPEITVNLYDASGNFITGDKFSVAGGRSSGDLSIPGELPLGRYYLAAYTPFQAGPDNVAILPITVHQFYESDALITLAKQGTVFKAGADANIELLINDLNGKPVDRFNFNYELWLGDKKLDDGKARSSMGRAAIRTTLPAETGNLPVELLITHPRNIWTKRFALKTTADRLEVKFYPEGGLLLGGVPQKMGYYVTAWGGTPVEAEADVIGSNGQLINKSKTFEPGYGLFPYKAAAGERARLVISSDYGKGQSFDLPEALPEGMVLTIPRADSLSILADILVAGQTKRLVGVTATRGYSLLWGASLEVSSNTRLRIPVSELGSGIVQLNLFDESEKLLSTRLAYIPEKKPLQVQVIAEPSAEGKVKVMVKTTDLLGNPQNAEVILSIGDKMRDYNHHQPISQSLTFEGELKNALPFVNRGEKSLSGTALDYCLISNELKCFSWERVMRSGGKDLEASINAMGISGRVTDKKGNPVAGAKISLMNNRDMQMHSAIADAGGKFSFPSLQPVDINDFNIVATDVNGKGMMQVELEPAFSQKVGVKARKLDYGRQEMERSAPEIARYLSENPDLLAGQPDIRPINTGTGRQQSESYKTLLQTATNLQEVIRSMKPYTLMNNQIVFAGTINSFNAQTGALIVVDGQKMGTQVDVLNTISPYDVEKINISLDPMDIQKYTGLNNVGVIEITLKRGPKMASELPAGMSKTSYRDGFRVPRNFLSTDGLEGKGGKDLRTTLYWEPEMKTGASGTITFSIPVSRVKSGFVIRATGFTENGMTGEGEAVFEVK